MRRSLPTAFALLLLGAPILSGCNDTEARGGASGNTATITQNGETVTRSSSGSQTIVRQSGGGDGAAAREASGADADRMLNSMRGEAGAAIDR
ncbi:hypothetical protein [Antarcticirhabdus aurantiaca]|uniref:Uncharacterized protein n=1 Tax=Antarcticirhabdus aurantiaca TaxID=2606717 RepID=A0ACD4NTD8_9HYPH|nr:hypothetical protein [Antarcticirhabdus aurantiaca]WAJ30067.1 hypothetical protein OXU80_07615 [Jeongeuplla avenae]